MGSFNSKIVSERNQRPSFTDITVLRAYFLRDGQYVPLDNTQVSSVHLFKKEANTSPNSILETSSGLIKNSAANDAIWRWALSGAGATHTGAGELISESQYTPADSSSCSSVFSVGDGRLAVILNGINTVSSVLRDGTTVSSNQQLSGQPATTYIDVWTVKLCAGCEWQTFINDTEFFQNNSVILTSPLLFSTKNRLFNKKIELGSIEKLKIGTEIIIENKDIDESVKNVLKDGLITSGAIQVVKHNDSAHTLPARKSVVSFAQSEQGGLVEVTSDNTFLYTLNTTLFTDTDIYGTDFGSPIGTYSVQIKYTLLDETRLSPLMYFTVV